MMAVQRSGAPRRRQPAVTRDRLLAAAVDLFAERGYDRVRVRDIAERAGVTTGAIYAHYPDVASLLADAAGRAVDHGVRAVADVQPGELVEGLLRGAATTSYGRRLSREQGLLLEAVVAARREPALRSALSEALGERLAVVQHAVEQGQAAGELRDDLSAAALAWFLYLAPIGMLTGRAAGLPGPDLDSLVPVFAAFIDSLRPDPARQDAARQKAAEPDSASPGAASDAPSGAPSKAASDGGA